MNLRSVAYNAILAYLDVVANFLGAYNAVLVDINVITDVHLGVLEAPLMFYSARSQYALFPNIAIKAHSNLCKITSEHDSMLDNCLAFN